jgi:hypothetical protein
MSSNHLSLPVFFFSTLQEPDLFYIAGWIADATGQSEDWYHHLHKLLIKQYKANKEFVAAAGTLQQMSWIAMAGDQRLFLLEVSTGGNIYVTGPSAIFNDPRLALAAWRRVIAHLRKIGIPYPIRTILDPSREIERGALKQLGFKTDDQEDEYGQKEYIYQ